MVGWRLRGYSAMHLQAYREDYGIFTKGKRVLCPYIALLCIILI